MGSGGAWRGGMIQIVATRGEAIRFAYPGYCMDCHYEPCRCPAASPAPEVLQGEQEAREALENADGGRDARQRAWERETGAPGNYTLHLALEKLNHLGYPALSEAVRRVAQENAALRSVQQDARERMVEVAASWRRDAELLEGAMHRGERLRLRACADELEALARLRSPST